MDNIDKFKQAASDRILLLDGAMGTLLQSIKISEVDYHGDRFKDRSTQLSGNYDILSLTRPEIISTIHKSYLEVGADIIKTNTFNSSVLEQIPYNTQDYVYRINIKAARLARNEADSFTLLTTSKPRFVAGVIGPTRYVGSKTISNKYGFEFKSFEEMKNSYRPQIEGLIDGGVDFLLLETIYNVDNTRAALSVLDDLRKNKFPVWLSATVIPTFDDKDTQNLLDGLIELINDYNVICLGLNCSTGISESSKYLEYLSNKTNLLVSFYPSAGLPDADGQYPINSIQFAKDLSNLAKRKIVNIVGGCCGTTSEYIQLLSKAIQDELPRHIQS